MAHNISASANSSFRRPHARPAAAMAAPIFSETFRSTDAEVNPAPILPFDQNNIIDVRRRFLDLIKKTARSDAVRQAQFALFGYFATGLRSWR